MHHIILYKSGREGLIEINQLAQASNIAAAVVVILHLIKQKKKQKYQTFSESSTFPSQGNKK